MKARGRGMSTEGVQNHGGGRSKFQEERSIEQVRHGGEGGSLARRQRLRRSAGDGWKILLASAWIVSWGSGLGDMALEVGQVQQPRKVERGEGEGVH